MSVKIEVKGSKYYSKSVSSPLSFHSVFNLYILAVAYDLDLNQIVSALRVNNSLNDTQLTFTEKKGIAFNAFGGVSTSRSMPVYFKRNWPFRFMVAERDH